MLNRNVLTVKANWKCGLVWSLSWRKAWPYRSRWGDVRLWTSRGHAASANDLASLSVNKICSCRPWRSRLSGGDRTGSHHLSHGFISHCLAAVHFRCRRHTVLVGCWTVEWYHIYAAVHVIGTAEVARASHTRCYGWISRGNARWAVTQNWNLYGPTISPGVCYKLVGWWRQLTSL